MLIPSSNIFNAMTARSWSIRISPSGLDVRTVHVRLQSRHLSRWLPLRSLPFFFVESHLHTGAIIGGSLADNGALVLQCSCVDWHSGVSAPDVTSPVWLLAQLNGFFFNAPLLSVLSVTRQVICFRKKRKVGESNPSLFVGLLRQVIILLHHQGADHLPVLRKRWRLAELNDISKRLRFT